jgi:site-specific recombinase XerD
MDALGIPSDKVRPLHGLRYYYASQLINSGADLKSVSALLAHDSLALLRYM